MIDLASHHKGDLTKKIELTKQAIWDSKLIEFDYYYKKGESHRHIEPYFIIFQWNAWYVFGYCLDRQDWRLFKLTRLWNLFLCNEMYTPREIPAEKRDFNAHLPDYNRLVALFDSTVRYQLIEAYGLPKPKADCSGWKSDTLTGIISLAGFWASVVKPRY